MRQRYIPSPNPLHMVLILSLCKIFIIRFSPDHADKLQVKLREEGGIRALLGMVRSRHPDVLAQVARGIANFAKCESRGAAQGIIRLLTLCDKLCSLMILILTLYRTSVGYKLGRSLLIDDGALPWIVANANNEASPIRRHIELALCHLAQHGKTSSFPIQCTGL